MTLNDLNRVAPGWKVGCSEGILSNAAPYGGIIDKNLVSGEWFVIFNNDNFEALDGFATRDEAIDAFVDTMMGEFVVDEM